MNCPKCGSPLPENSRFCGMCGAQLNQPAQSNQPPKQQPNTSPQVHIPAQYQRQQQPQQVQQPQPQQQYYNNQQQYYNQPAYAGAAAAQPQKKKGKGGIVIGIIIAIIALLVLLGFAFKTAITKSIMGELSYYAMAEANTISAIADNDEFEGLLNNEEFSFDANGPISFGDGEMSGTLSGKGSYSSEQDKATAKVKLTNSANNESLDFVLNMGNGKLGMEYDGDAIIIPIGATDLETDELGELIAKIYPIIRKAEKDHLSSGIATATEVIDGRKYKVTTFSIKESDLDYAIADVLEAAMQDEEIMASIKKVLEDNAGIINQFSKELDGMNASEIYTKITTSLPDLIKTIRAEADALVAQGKASMITYKVAYKNSKEILQRQFTAGNTSFTIKTVTVGNTSTVTYTQGNNNTVQYVVTNTNGKTTAQLTGVIDNTSFSFTASDMEIKEQNGVKVPVGTIDFHIADSDSGKITMTADSQYHLKAEWFDGRGKALDADLSITLSDKADLSEYKEPKEDEHSKVEDFSNFFDM